MLTNKLSLPIQLTTTVQWTLQSVGHVENYMTSGEFSRTLKPMSSTFVIHLIYTLERDGPKITLLTVMFEDICLCCYPDGPVLKGIRSGASSSSVPA